MSQTVKLHENTDCIKFNNDDDDHYFPQHMVQVGSASGGD